MTILVDMWGNYMHYKQDVFHSLVSVGLNHFIQRFGQRPMKVNFCHQLDFSNLAKGLFKWLL